MSHIIRLFLLLLLVSCSKTPVVQQMQVSEQIQPIPAATQQVPTKKPVYRGKVEKKLIVIDPGHGGEDDGTKSLTKPKYREKHLNLATAKMLQAYLEQMGYRTIMTRNEDVFIGLKERAKMANDLKPDLFVSVHYNAAESTDAQGVEVFFYQSKTNPERTASSKQLAQNILDRIIVLTQAKSRGVKHGNLAVIRETQMPAVLVEGGFLTNKNEIEKLKDPAYLKMVAWGIAQGIQTYINNTKK